MKPYDARTFPLVHGTKIPTKGTRGHLDAQPNADFEGNYGIALDGQYLVVDFDREPPARGFFAEGRELPETWVQSTRRGQHWLYRLPEGADLSRARNGKFGFGDVKIRGYIVGPGSVVSGVTYSVQVAKDPVSAPSWLWDYVTQEPAVVEEGVDGNRDSISEGNRDDDLARIGGLLRRMGLSQEAIAKGLNGINTELVQPPYPARDINRIAKSVSKYEPEGEEGGPLRPSGWTAMDEIAYVGPPTRWWIRGFIPRGELVTLFGPGSVGKSSFGSWLASQVTQRDGRVAVVSVEEPVKRFAWRANLNGADLSRILAVPNASSLSFPRDAKGLREALEVTKTDVLYIDSIYSHFDYSVEGQNAAERARSALAPLAEIAQETGTTIVAVFHLNKVGTPLGSVEMVNVPRYVLEAARAPGKPLYVRVHKTNLWNPGVSMVLKGIEVPASDPHTGAFQMDEDENGNEVPASFVILERQDDAPNNTIDSDDVISYEESKSTRLTLKGKTSPVDTSSKIAADTNTVDTKQEAKLPPMNWGDYDNSAVPSSSERDSNERL